MKYLLTLISTLLLFASCSKDEKPDFTKQKATRAIMIYMAGENNLTQYSNLRALQEDLAEIVEGSKLLSDNQRVFVFVDSLGTNSDKQWNGKPYIIEVHGGNVYDRKQYDSDFYSCDPDKFREIVSWMTSNIQADGYGLVLWGHASGWVVEKDTIVSSRRAYGLDEGKDLGQSSKWMNITQMSEALKGLSKLDFIFADCCNMMSAEVGYELRNVTKYLIGSSAEIPGSGAPYDEILPLLFKNDKALYQGIIDTYYNYYVDAYNISNPSLAGYSLPLSVIDTQYMPQLAQATRSILDSFTDGYPQYPKVLSLRNIAYYIHIDAAMMYDMRAVIKSHTSDADFQQWDNIYKQAVPYYRMSLEWMTIYNNLKYAFNSFNQDESLYGCVSMYFPQNESAYIGGQYEYNKTASNFEWNRIIDWGRYGW